MIRPNASLSGCSSGGATVFRVGYGFLVARVAHASLLLAARVAHMSLLLAVGGVGRRLAVSLQHYIGW